MIGVARVVVRRRVVVIGMTLVGDARHRLAVVPARGVGLVRGARHIGAVVVVGIPGRSPTGRVFLGVRLVVVARLAVVRLRLGRRRLVGFRLVVIGDRDRRGVVPVAAVVAVAVVVARRQVDAEVTDGARQPVLCGTR